MALYSPQQVVIARENIQRYEKAQEIAHQVITAADRWVDRSVEFIHERMPDGRVPRALAVNYVTGCPIHGEAAARSGVYGTSNWIVDVFEKPWKVTCRIGGESYPSNDFGAFYGSGMSDRSLLTGDFPDDGHGYLAPGLAYRHWFVAYACYQTWSEVIGGLEALARAYLLTSDERYARQALLMLERLAHVYAGMDYRSSMYSTEMSPGYSGKILPQISETMTIQRVARALDHVSDLVSPQIRTRIESGLLREMLRAVYDGHARGNYAMHQAALLTTALVLDDKVELTRAVDWTLHNTGEATPLKEMRTCFGDYIFRDRAAHAEGLKWAVDNLLFREGIGWESSPGYSVGWIGHLVELAGLLELAGAPVWDQPKLRRMLDWPVEMASFGRCTPAIGDAGSILSAVTDVDPHTLRLAYEHYGDAVLAARLREAGSTGEGSFTCFEDLFLPPLRDAELERVASGTDLGLLRNRSRLMGGYGLALLRAGDADQSVAATLYYGRAATEHGHFDRLSLELYAHGRKMIPDLGYPIHAGEGSEPALWTKNTAAHATVVVDERRQTTQAAGRLCGFVAVPGLQYVEVDAARTYHQTSEYRRTVILAGIESGSESSAPAAQAYYLLDLFHVHGGRRHDYSLHGFDAQFTVQGMELSAPAPGTLAGTDVAYGSAYDDPDLDRPHRIRCYYSYAGSGYSYLTGVQRGRAVGVWTATWADAEAGLRVHVLPWTHNEVIVADGPLPQRTPDPKRIKYLILRHDGDPAISSFVTVLEPFRGSPLLRQVAALNGTSSEGTTGPLKLRVEHVGGSDTWTLYACGESARGLRLTREVRGPSGQVKRVDVIGSGTLRAQDIRLTVRPACSGRITAVRDEDHTVEIELEGGRAESGDFQSLAGETALIGNPRHGTSYTVIDAKPTPRGLAVRFGPESFRIGHFRVGTGALDGSAITTPTYLYMAAQGYYRGTRLVDHAMGLWGEIDDVVLAPHHPGCRREGRITLREPAGPGLAQRLGKEAFIYDFGPGDRFDIVPHLHAVRRADGSWSASGHGSFDMA